MAVAASLSFHQATPLFKMINWLSLKSDFIIKVKVCFFELFNIDVKTPDNILYLLSILYYIM